jgi:hypothetical protein
MLDRRVPNLPAISNTMARRSYNPWRLFTAASKDECSIVVLTFVLWCIPTGKTQCGM